MTYGYVSREGVLKPYRIYTLFGGKFQQLTQYINNNNALIIDKL